MSRGGARPGAGRKRTEDARVILSCRVTPATRAALEARAEQEHKGIGVILDELSQSFRTFTITAPDAAAAAQEPREAIQEIDKLKMYKQKKERS